MQLVQNISDINSFLCALLIPSEDHWLGLKKVYSVTKNKTKNWIMRVDLLDHEDVSAFAEYKNFRLENEKAAFKLHVGKYSGNAGTVDFLTFSF